VPGDEKPKKPQLTQDQHHLQGVILRRSRRYQIDVTKLDPESTRELIRLLRDYEDEVSSAKSAARRGHFRFGG
jgi:hypothetical protein